MKGKKKFKFKLSDTRYIASLKIHFGVIEVESITPPVDLSSIEDKKIWNLDALISLVKEQPGSDSDDVYITIETAEFEVTEDLKFTLREFSSPAALSSTVFDPFQMHVSRGTKVKDFDPESTTVMPILPIVRDIIGLSALSGLFYLRGLSVPGVLIADVVTIFLGAKINNRMASMTHQKVEELMKEGQPLNAREIEAFESGVNAGESFTGYFNSWLNKSSYQELVTYEAGKSLAKGHQAVEIDDIKKRYRKKVL